MYFHAKQYLETLLQPYLVKEIDQNSTTKIILVKNWSEILHLDEQNVNLSMTSYLDQTKSISDIHAPFKKLKMQIKV